MGDGRGIEGDEPGASDGAVGAPAALARGWPPEDPPGTDYRRASLAGTRLVAATRLPDDAVLALARGGDAVGWSLVPVVADASRGGRWRRALAGDGAASALVRALRDGRPLAGGFRLEPGPATGAFDALEGLERALGTDQTNETVIVDGRWGVKWLLHPDPARERAPRLLRHLAAAGFPDVPALLGMLTWRTDASATPLTLALVDAWLPGSRDGWDWCTDAVIAHVAPGHPCDTACPAAFSPALGRLVARLHAALATPTSVIPAPVARVDRAVVEGWAAGATRAIREAVALTAADDAEVGADLRLLAPRLEARIARLDVIDGALVQPVHGDLHVGQVLQGPHGLAVIDLDGNPTADAATLRSPAPAARDVAGMLCSLDHVGRIAIRRGADAVRTEAWIRDAETDFLAGYQAGLRGAGREELLDARLLSPFRVEQEARELIYAARFLPRWRHAPLGAIRAMVGT